MGILTPKCSVANFSSFLEKSVANFSSFIEKISKSFEIYEGIFEEI